MNTSDELSKAFNTLKNTALNFKKMLKEETCELIIINYWNALQVKINDFFSKQKFGNDEMIKTYPLKRFK